ncbi:hypothetical protein [Bermanella sp. R86510]|uniref:hypothetical protein n=1 Tax=unclassified Bermanella TaxID=2627862 RepID=UPI0037C82FD3
MKLIAILALLYITFEALYGVYLRGFPSYEKHPNLSYWQSLFHSGFLEPYARIFVAAITGGLIFAIIKSIYIEKVVDTEMTGVVKAITYSNTRLNNKPLVNLEVEFLDLSILFKNQTGDLGFKYPVGSQIPIKFNKSKPSQAIILVDSEANL